VEKWLWEQFVICIQALSGGNLLLALVLIAAFAAVAGIVLATVIRVIRALLPFLVFAGFAILCWKIGLLSQCWQLLAGLVR
jgi:hypothetical protein